ncbi:MAG TPA: ABC transporter ATP-binding protein [Gemmatimonadaceae bacterium]|nr:ABC transporter ATP-binding protein [Gemmatimonadaceae bacterium]
MATFRSFGAIPPALPSTATRALAVRRLRKSYEDVVAVHELDLEVLTGECFGLLGPNGAGKTTTIEICEGLLDADEGVVELFGRPWSSHATELRQRIGAQLQETQLSDRLTVDETLRLFRSFYHDGYSVDELVALMHLEEKRTARVAKLSGGQRQRLALGCALAGRPDLLFLDEPTTGLDPQSRRQLWELIERYRASGRTILLTTHYMDEAERLCDRIAIVDHGRVIAHGTPRALIASLGAEHVVEFALDEGQTVDVSALRALPGVHAVREARGRWELDVEKIHRCVPALLALTNAHSLGLTELRTHSATLEDVFVSLTGRHLREP